MEKTANTGNLNIFKLTFFLLITWFSFFLFYSQVYCKLDSDLRSHIAFIDMSITGILTEHPIVFDHSVEGSILHLYVLAKPSPKQTIVNGVLAGKLKFLNLPYSAQPQEIEHNVFLDNIETIKLPEVGLEYTVYWFAKLFGMSYEMISIFLLTIALVGATYITFFLLKIFLDVSDGYLMLFTVLLSVVSAIYDPLFSKWICLGQGCANVWHNPTLFMVKSFALLCVYFGIKQLQTFDKKMWLSSSILLLASLFYKPSFGIVFIPAYAIYILLFYTRNFKAYLYSFLMVLPSLAYALLYQLPRLINYIPSDGERSSIGLVPFKFIHAYSHNALISFLLGMAFPLAMLILSYKKVLANRYLVLSWIMFFLGYFQYAFLVEGGSHWQDGNFSWGYYLALDFLFIFSFIELVKQALSYKMTTNVERVKIWVLSIIFSLHAVSGFFYLIKYLVVRTGIGIM